MAVDFFILLKKLSIVQWFYEFNNIKNKVGTKIKCWALVRLNSPWHKKEVCYIIKFKSNDKSQDFKNDLEFVPTNTY